jgi:hypothetical protein
MQVLEIIWADEQTNNELHSIRLIGTLRSDIPFMPAEWVHRLMLMTVSLEHTVFELMIRSTTLCTATASEPVHQSEPAHR